MKNSLLKEVEISNNEIYKSKISEIDGMQEYVNDVEIFNSDSLKFKNFLATSFAQLHPDFHYLSFLKSEDIDSELIKVAEILQILKTTTKKTGKLLENFNNNEIHGFWMKFFSLFTTNKKSHSNEGFLFETKNQYQFFSDLESIQNYLNYDFPLINLKKIKSVDVNEEIEKWDMIQNFDFNVTVNEVSDMGKNINKVNIEKLIIDLKHIVTTYNKIERMQEKYMFVSDDFFVNFNNTVKSIFKYKNVNNLKSLISEKEYLQNENKTQHWDNLYFLKNYNNLNNILKSKIQQL